MTRSERERRKRVIRIHAELAAERMREVPTLLELYGEANDLPAKGHEKGSAAAWLIEKIRAKDVMRGRAFWHATRAQSLAFELGVVLAPFTELGWSPRGPFRL